jgi:hypothetical protein
VTRKPDRTSDGVRGGGESLERLADLTRRIMQVPKSELPLHRPIRKKRPKKK